MKLTEAERDYLEQTCLRKLGYASVEEMRADGLGLTPCECGEACCKGWALREVEDV